MATGTAYALDFERPLIELEKKIEELKVLSTSGSVDFSSEISKLEKKAKKLQTEIFSDLSRWQVVQLSRHTARPYFLDYIQLAVHRLLRAVRATAASARTPPSSAASRGWTASR